MLYLVGIVIHLIKFCYIKMELDNILKFVIFIEWGAIIIFILWSLAIGARLLGVI